jgi:hypothetical protein
VHILEEALTDFRGFLNTEWFDGTRNCPVGVVKGLWVSSSPFDLRGVSVTGEAGSDDLGRAGAGRSSLIQRRHGGA